jgi:hypothetical protein
MASASGERCSYNHSDKLMHSLFSTCYHKFICIRWIYSCIWSRGLGFFIHKVFQSLQQTMLSSYENRKVSQSISRGIWGLIVCSTTSSFSSNTAPFLFRCFVWSGLQRTILVWVMTFRHHFIWIVEFHESIWSFAFTKSPIASTVFNFHFNRYFKKPQAVMTTAKYWW